MPKAKRMKGRRKKKYGESHTTPLDSDEEGEYNSYKSAGQKFEDYHDEIDSFHAQKDKILLGDEHSDQESPEEEEIFPLSDDDSDLEEQFTAKLKKDAISSDLEDNEERDLPDVKAWGKKKSTYYNTNFIDQDFRRGYREDDAEAADAEEKEALALQKRLIEDIDESDFGLEWFKVEKKTPEKEPEMEEKIPTDFSRLSQREKLEFLAKEAPELMDLIKDFKEQLTELEDNLQPLLPLVKDGRMPPGPEAIYITTKYQLILHYCTNISYYMILKARGTPVRHHPVIKRLVNYRNLLKQLEPCDVKLRKDIKMAVEKLKNGEDFQILSHRNTDLKSVKSKRLRVLQNFSQKKSLEDSKQEVSNKRVADSMSERKMKPKKIKHFETEEEKEILSMYEDIKEKRRLSEDSEDEKNNIINMEEEGKTSGTEDEADQEEKRGITYEIAKNKGLLPQRKKEYRNPRVRHRMKFKKAKIRRKGQVREVRQELQRYGGEVSGIRIGVTRSVKLK